MIADPFAVTEGVVGLYDPPAHRADGVEGVDTVGAAFTVNVTVKLFVVPQPLVAVYLTFLPLSANATVYGTIKLV